MYPLIHGILTNHLLPKEDDCPEILYFKEKVTKNLHERFLVGKEHECDDIIASALHPCYKKLKFLSKQSRMFVKVKLEEINAKMALEMTSRSETEIPELPVVPPKIKREYEEHCEAAMKYLLRDIYEVSDDEEDTIEAEVSRYMTNPRNTIQPLIWWKANAHCFPHLSKLARQFLCKPSTSVPSERLFSTAGHTVTKDRAKLDPDTVDELLFLHCYYKKKGSAHQQELETKEATLKAEASGAHHHLCLISSQKINFTDATLTDVNIHYT